MHEQYVKAYAKGIIPNNPIIQILEEHIHKIPTFCLNLLFIYNRAGMLKNMIFINLFFLCFGMQLYICFHFNIFFLVHVYLILDDRLIQLSISKFLVVIFTTPSTANLFYTNDLKVIVDILLRELRAVAGEDEVRGEAFWVFSLLLFPSSFLFDKILILTNKKTFFLLFIQL